MTLRSTALAGGALAVAALVVAVVLLLPGWASGHFNPTVQQTLADPGPEARALHATLDIVDLHDDALLWNRDLLERGNGHTDIPRLIEGRVAVQAFTTVIKTPRGQNNTSNTADSDMITVLAVLSRWPPRTWTDLTERALHQASKLRSTAARSDGALTIIESVADLDAFLARHERDPATVAGFLGVEGGHALEGELIRLDTLYAAGFRMLGLTHFFDNALAGSAHGVDRGGLTPFGRRVVDRMQVLGMLVDLAHVAPAAMDDALARATRPMVVSHGGVRATCDNPRNVDDDRLRALAATGGVMGVGLWDVAVCGTTAADWARAVRHAADVMGADHVALGSDWDGTIEAIVDASGTVHLAQALLDQGFTHEEVRGILGGNTLRVLRAALPAG